MIKKQVFVFTTDFLPYNIIPYSLSLFLILSYAWDTIGHRKQLLSLEQEIKEAKIAHAYLFAGPQETGKYHIAKTFASILQCPNGYCRTCEDCRQIQKGIHVDTVLMEDKGETITIDQMRELIQKTHLSAQGPHRIIVIENIERMPLEAQNSFLKILEEPPGATIFILTTSQIEQVLPTIQSRTRNYSFFGLDDTIIRDYIKEKYGALDRLDEIVTLAQGRPGMAIKLAQNPDFFLTERNLYLQIEKILSRNDLVSKMTYVEEMEGDEAEVNRFLDAFTRYLRKLLYDYMNASDAHRLQPRFSFQGIADLFESLQKTRYLMDRNVNKRLALENFMIQTEV